MGIEETLARAAKFKQELEEKKRESYNAWAQDAQQAWDEGRMFYQPAIPVFWNHQQETPRAKSAEQALQAITAAGWRLHTWTVVAGAAMGGSVRFAHPLFDRGE